MAAIGLGLPRQTFKDAGKYGYFSSSTFGDMVQFHILCILGLIYSRLPRLTLSNILRRTPSSLVSTPTSTFLQYTAVRAILVFTYGLATRASAFQSSSQQLADIC